MHLFCLLARSREEKNGVGFQCDVDTDVLLGSMLSEAVCCVLNNVVDVEASPALLGSAMLNNCEGFSFGLSTMTSGFHGNRPASLNPAMASSGLAEFIHAFLNTLAKVILVTISPGFSS